MPDTRADPPLQGADAIHDGELEVGFDERFEDAWRWAEVGGRVFMGAIVAAGLAGLFGRGPFSHRSSGTAGGAVMVDREPIAHYGTATQVTLHVDPARIGPEDGDSWVVHLNNQFVEPMGLQTATPLPTRQTADGAGVALHVRLDAGRQDDLVRLVLKPTEVGLHHLVARVGTAEVGWDQLVLP